MSQHVQTIAIALLAAAMLATTIIGLVEKVNVSDDLRALESTLCARIHQDIKNAKFTRNKAKQPPSIRSFHGSLIPELRRELGAVACP